MDRVIVSKINQYIIDYKAQEKEGKFDDAIRLADDALLYIQARIDGGVNFADKAVLESFSRDVMVVKRTL